MLTRGNGKLGLRGRIWGFGLPSLVTCPGRTETCSTHCYSARLEARRPSVRTRYQQNLALSRRDDFAELVCGFVGLHQIEVVRVHTAGDFYSAEYARRWLVVMRRLPSVRFYLYTRSWRVPSIRRELVAMSRLSNAWIWFSLDSDVSSPGRIPMSVRLAWLMTTDEDKPERADLVFRTAGIRGRVCKRVSLRGEGEALVCPTENGITGHRTDCGRCGVCWEPLPMDVSDSNRLSLPVTH